MNAAKRGGRIQRNAIRVSEPLGMAIAAVTATAAVVAGTVVPMELSAAPPAVDLSADSTALVLCGTTCPTPDGTYIDIVKRQYIGPIYPDRDIDYVAVTTPEEFWPITGVFRLLGLAIGDPRIFAPGGPAWPDEPWWKISGLFDLTANQSLQGGAAALEAAIADHGGDDLVIYGLSQGAGVANVVKKHLAARYPAGTNAPDIDFVLSGDPNTPNGGLMSRFPGLYVPILDMPFNGAAATDTPFTTVEISRQYDGFTDFPLYPLNLLADLNAVLGVLYVHTNFFDVSLPPDPTTSPAYRGTHGDTSYYFFESRDLPLFAPLRMLGVPENLIDVVEPFVRAVVELGYDRSIPLWEPTPARLFPPLRPAKVTPAVPPAETIQIDPAVAPRELAAPSRQVSMDTQPVRGTAEAGEASMGETVTAGPTERPRSLPRRGNGAGTGTHDIGPVEAEASAPAASRARASVASTARNSRAGDSSDRAAGTSR